MNQEARPSARAAPTRTDYLTVKDEADMLLEGFTAEERREVMAGVTAALCELAAAAEQERAAIGQANQVRRRAVEGVGGETLNLHPFDYHFQRFLGHDWRDPDFRRWLGRQRGTNPGTTRGDDYSYARVNAGGTKLVVAGASLPKLQSEPKPPRFRKVYGVGEAPVA